VATDNELMERVKQGDLNQLDLIYQKYSRILLAFFYRMTFNTSVSEDLVHNVFIRILRYRDNYHGDGQFSTWLFHLAHNIRNDHYRKNRFAHMTDNNVQALEIADDQNPASVYETSERAAILKGALEELSLEQREVLILSRYHGLKYREIADILKCSENTVKARNFRAVEKLRRVYRRLESRHEQETI